MHLLRVRLHYSACREIGALEVKIRRPQQLGVPIGGGDVGECGLNTNGKDSAAPLKPANNISEE
jgi:hypothetical protein